MQWLQIILKICKAVLPWIVKKLSTGKLKVETIQIEPENPNTTVVKTAPDKWVSQRYPGSDSPTKRPPKKSHNE